MALFKFKIKILFYAFGLERKGRTVREMVHDSVD
jgi:hypothetical protein